MAIIVLEPEVIEILEPDVSQLITEDDTPVDNIFSERQQRLLTDALYASWGGPVADGETGERRPFIALANVGLYYGINEPPLVPDVLVSLDVQLPEDIWTKKNRTYMVWEYGKPPDVVIEIVSNRVGEEMGEKLGRYARSGVGSYVVFDPIRQLSRKPLRLFERHNSAYTEAEVMWLPELQLGLTLWEGVYEDAEETWLRWCDSQGNILLTGKELAEQERERAEQEWERAEQERERAEQERERAKQERERAEQERERAEQERVRAAQERERAEREHERAERLAAQLRASGIEPEA
jgi:Uma2 family endonuclease